MPGLFWLALAGCGGAAEGQGGLSAVGGTGTHLKGVPMQGAVLWATRCKACHGAVPSDASFDGRAGAGTGPHYPLAYYASDPRHLESALAQVSSGLMVPYQAEVITNQDDLSAFFASLMVPVLSQPADQTVTGGSPYGLQIGAVPGQDYLVATTQYAVSSSLPLTVNASGWVSGRLPVVSAPTPFTVTLSASNPGAGSATVSYTLTVR
ncbi:MAG: hypothetical protein Fur0040_10240 [Sideroxydans sp.]